MLKYELDKIWKALVKLLIVSQYFYPENFRVNELVGSLVKRGHEVTVLTGQPNYPTPRFFDGYSAFSPREEEHFGARIVRVPLVPRGRGGALRLILNYLSFALFACIAVYTRLRGPFDAIFVFQVSPATVGWPAAVAGRRFGAPILFWVLDLWPHSLQATGFTRSLFLLAAVGRGVRWIYDRCDQVLVQSRAFRENIEEMGVHPDNIRYFPNWIEDDYAGEVIQSTKQPEKNGFRVVYAGNIGVAQGFPEIVEAARILRERMPEARWIIAGDGRISDWLHQEVERLKLDEQFEFLGQLSPSEMPALFASADALLVSLKADPTFEVTIPGKVQSYMASGRPIMAMLDGEGARVINESGGGLAVAAGDSLGLAEKLLALARLDTVARENMGRCGRDYALREFNRVSLLDKLEIWLEEAVAKNGQQNDAVRGRDGPGF